MAEKSVLPKIVKQFGPTKLVFDVELMTPGMMDKVKEIVAEIKAADSIYVRSPAGEGQTHEDYAEDVQGSDPELIRRIGETPQAHAKRVMAPTMKTADYAFEIINGMSQLFKQPELAREDFDSVPMHEIRTFVFNILNFCDCPTAAEFVPKRIVDGKQFR